MLPMASSKGGVCHNPPISRNKVFPGLGQRDGMVLGLQAPPAPLPSGSDHGPQDQRGTTDARQPLEPMGAPGRGKVVAEKGSSSKFPMKPPWQGGLPLLAGMSSTMKTPLRPLLDRLLVRKRSSSATLFEALKWGMGLEHSGHGSPPNSFVPLLSCLAA